MKLIGVTSQGWVGPGVQIVGGQNIQIIGGTYSGNGSTSAGIAITGTPANISMVGADLSAKYSGAATVQQDALQVSGSPTTVLCKSCTMLGYSGIPVQVTGAPSNLQIIDGAGYNDLAKVLTTTLPGSGSTHTFSNTTVSSTTPWYGPIAFYVSAVSNVHIDNNPTGTTTGGFTLSPNETAYLTYTGTPTFLAVGK